MDYSYFLGGQTVSTDEVRKILKSYDIDKDDIYIIPYHPPISSWMGDCFIHRESEDFEAKRAAYIQKIRDLILE